MLNFTKFPGQSPKLSSGRIGKLNRFPCRLGDFVILNQWEDQPQPAQEGDGIQPGGVGRSRKVLSKRD
jgi:hypothetical protein